MMVHGDCSTRCQFGRNVDSQRLHFKTVWVYASARSPAILHLAQMENGTFAG